MALTLQCASDLRLLPRLVPTNVDAPRVIAAMRSILSAVQRVRDLLNPEEGTLQIRQDTRQGVFVEGCCQEYVASADELLQLVRFAETNRVTGVTGMNDASSRSHMVVMITITMRDTVSGSLQVSRLTLVDLAGSEQVSRTGAEGITLEEARMINRSLFTLSKCISALAVAAAPGGSGAGAFIPYRDSKLTRLLQESLGGNAKTALVVCCSPCSSNQAETLSTLRFGTQAKQIKNKPVVNRVRSVEELERLLNKAEAAIDAQAVFIRALEEQLVEAQAAAAAATEENRPATAAAAAATASPTASSPTVPTGLADIASMAGAEGSERAGSAVPAPAMEAPAGGKAERQEHVASAAAHHHAPPAPAVDNTAVLLELAELRQQLSAAQQQHQLDAEELVARAEETRVLSAALADRERRLQAAERIHAEAMTASIAEATARAHSEALLTLRSFQCGVCNGTPFADVVDTGGVCVLHESACFQEREARAAVRRMEERTQALHAELENVKACLDDARLQAQRPASPTSARRPASPPRTPPTQAFDVALVDHDTASTANRIEGSSNPLLALSQSDAERLGEAEQQREVVDAAVVQDLQSRLTSLVHAHRQLLRKYAVVDVECGELAEGLAVRSESTRCMRSTLVVQYFYGVSKGCVFSFAQPTPRTFLDCQVALLFSLQARDRRIDELTRASLTFTARIQATRNEYDAKLREQSASSAAEVAGLRAELRALALQVSIRFAGAHAGCHSLVCVNRESFTTAYPLPTVRLPYLTSRRRSACIRCSCFYCDVRSARGMGGMATPCDPQRGHLNGLQQARLAHSPAARWDRRRPQAAAHTSTAAQRSHQVLPKTLFVLERWCRR